MPIVRNIRIHAENMHPEEAAVRFEQPILNTDVKQLANVLTCLKRNVRYPNLTALVDDSVTVFNRSDFAKRKKLSAIITQIVPDWDFEICI